MERWMIIYLLPLEVWMDIFVYPWISRKKFVRMVDRIGNFKFAEHAQFYLHEWGKEKLGNLAFEKDGLCKYVKHNPKPYRLNFPRSPMPENIKAFDAIQIRNFDANALDFLAKIRPLLAEVKLNLGSIPPNRLETVRTILTNLAPMLDGIQSLWCADESTFSMVRELFSENEKLAKLKWFEIVFATETVPKIQLENVDFITNWLNQPDSAGPKLLECHEEFSEQIFEAIHEQFLSAKTPSTFAVNMKLYSWEERQVDEFHLENGIGEELHGDWTQIDREKVFQITRHKAGWNTKEAREWIEAKAKGRDDRKIWIYCSSTVGRLDVAPQLPPVDEEEEDQQQPGCSIG